MGVFGITKILEEEAFGDPKSIVRNSYRGGCMGFGDSCPTSLKGMYYLFVFKLKWQHSSSTRGSVPDCDDDNDVLRSAY